MFRVKILDVIHFIYACIYKRLKRKRKTINFEKEKKILRNISYNSSVRFNFCCFHFWMSFNNGIENKPIANNNLQSASVITEPDINENLSHSRTRNRYQFQSTMWSRWLVLLQMFLLYKCVQSMPGSSNNYKINPKPCTVNSYEGTCMFVWECIKSEGQHIGMCVDSFMFGSCCAHNLTENIVVPHQVFDFKPPPKRRPSPSSTINAPHPNRPHR